MFTCQQVVGEDMLDRESDLRRGQGKGEYFEREIETKAEIVGGYATQRNVEILGAEVDVIGILPRYKKKSTGEVGRHQPERIVIECKDWQEGEYVRQKTIWRTVCLANKWDAHPFLAISDCKLTNRARMLRAEYHVGILRAGNIENESDFYVFGEPHLSATQQRPKNADEIREFSECWKNWPYEDD